MPSLMRTIRHARAVGFREWFRQMTSTGQQLIFSYIGDAKFGRHVGTDQFGNRYFEQMDPREEVPGRQRWVDYSQDDFNASQVPRGWASWLSHIRMDPPPEDKIMQQLTPPWQAPFVENLTGTRGRYTTYSTTAPKVRAWEPEAKPRGSQPSA